MYSNNSRTFCRFSNPAAAVNCSRRLFSSGMSLSYHWFGGGMISPERCDLGLFNAVVKCCEKKLMKKRFLVNVWKNISILNLLSCEILLAPAFTEKSF